VNLVPYHAIFTDNHLKDENINNFYLYILFIFIILSYVKYL